MNNALCKKPIVTIALNGGLGNQLFQYAAALGLAVQQGRNLKIDLSLFPHHKDRPYQLNRLKVPQHFYKDPPLSAPMAPMFMTRLLRTRIIGKIKRHTKQPRSLYCEPHFHFDPAFFNLPGAEVRLAGYFQSPRYFVGVEALLRERFQLQAPFTPTASAWAAKIAQSPCAVSVHLRRGDYLKPQHSTTHNLLDRGYYDRAMTLIKDLVGDGAEFFFFSDAPDFVADTFANLPRVHIVRSEPTAPWEDLFLMRQCRHNIIANSSYSWWGAWLNETVDKRIIAPAQWFTSDYLATCNVVDLYPEDWILLK